MKTLTKFPIAFLITSYLAARLKTYLDNHHPYMEPSRVMVGKNVPFPYPQQSNTNTNGIV